MNKGDKGWKHSPERTIIRICEPDATSHRGRIEIVLDCGHTSRIPMWLSDVRPRTARCKKCRDGQPWEFIDDIDAALATDGDANE